MNADVAIAVLALLAMPAGYALLALWAFRFVKFERDTRRPGEADPRPWLLASASALLLAAVVAAAIHWARSW